MATRRTGVMVFQKTKGKPQPMPRSMFQPAIAAKMSQQNPPRDWWSRMAGIISRSLIIYRSKAYMEWRDDLGARICQLAAQAKWYRASTGPVGLRMTVHGTVGSGDLDKILGSVFDAAQLMAVGDDCQFTDVDVKLRLSGKREIELELYVPEDPGAARWAESALAAQEQKTKARLSAALKRRARI